jgi:exonuclease III
MSGTYEISILSWNVRGLCEPSRKTIARNWLNTVADRYNILMLQELKADESRLNNALSYIKPNYQQVIAYPNDGCGGTTLLSHPQFTISNSGVTTRGMVWASIVVGNKLYYVGSIYAPNTYGERKKLWNAICAFAPPGKWIIAGDYNMVESQNDSTSCSPVLEGTELDEWRLLKLKLSLKDAASVCNIEGPLFTRRGSPDDRLVQSRLDRFYFSEWAELLK